MAEKPTSDGQVTREQLIELLNEDLAREYHAIIAYVVYSQVLKGAEYMSIAEELQIHAGEELEHALIVAKLIDYLGGDPVVTPKPVKTSDKARDMLRAGAQTLLPGGEIHGARIGGEHDELREREVRSVSDVSRGVKGGWSIAWKAEDEGAEDVHAMLAKRSKTRNQRLANIVEALVHVLQAFRCDRLDADERAADVGLAHRIEVAIRHNSETWHQWLEALLVFGLGRGRE